MSQTKLPKFTIYCNGEKTKAKCAAFPRPIPPNETAIPVTTNGAIICGKQQSGKCLVVIDFDILATESYLDVGAIYKFLEKTLNKQYISPLTVRSGKGGLHIYTEITNGEYGCKAFVEVDKKSGKHTRIRINETIKKMGVVEIDIRGEGGIIFAPGCKFDEHPMPYVIVQKDTPLQLTLAEFNSIINALVTTIEQHPTKMRQGFVDMWMGDFLITHVTQTQTGMPEFLYWGAFWREYFNCGGDKDVAYKQLTLTQPEFDAKTTDEQLKYLAEATKRPSKDFYIKLFPKYASGGVSETSDYFAQQPLPEPSPEQPKAQVALPFTLADVERLIDEKITQKFQLFGMATKIALDNVVAKPDPIVQYGTEKEKNHSWSNKKKAPWKPSKNDEARMGMKP